MGIIPKKNTTLTSAATAFATKERAFGNKKKTTDRPDDERRINKKSLLRRGLIEEQSARSALCGRTGSTGHQFGYVESLIFPSLWQRKKR